MPSRSPRQPVLAEIRSALNVASEAREAGDHRRGVEAARRALDLARQADHLRFQASALGLLALHEWRLGDEEAAIAHGLQALPTLKRPRDAGERTQVLCTLVMAYNDVGLHRDALTYVTKAMDAARQAGDPSLMSWALNRAGVTYEGLADAGKAERFLLQALAIAREIDGPEEMFSALNNLCSNLSASARSAGSTAEKEERLHRALGFAAEALVLAEASGNTHREAICHGNLATANILLGRHELALAHIEHEERLADEHGYRALKLGALSDRALLLREQGDMAAAIVHYRQALERVAGTDDQAAQLGAHEGLYLSYKASGDLARALEHHEAMLPLEREQMKQRADTQARLLLHRIELEHARTEAERARLDAEVQRLRAMALESENEQLEARTRELGRHALEDQLTGLANRRRVDHELPVQLAFARERHAALSVAAVDLDHFKSVNDRYGHAVGDDVLRVVARVLLDNTRSSDLLARMGGEEFLVLFVGTPLAVASDICERLRQAVESHHWGSVAPGLTVTVSIGLCDAVDSADMRALLERADASLYAAKRGGRNRVEVALA